MAQKAPRTPLDTVRDAFESLSTQDKTAFVVEATFDTIGQALAETGRHVADAVEDFSLDEIFRWDTDRPAPEPEAPDAPPPAATRTSASKGTPRKRPGGTSIEPDSPAV